MGSGFQRIHPGAYWHAVPLDAKHSCSCAVDRKFSFGRFTY